jgi:WD40 repeat protein
MNFFRLALFSVLILKSITAFGQGHHYVLALSKAEKMMFVLDYKTLELVAKIRVGEDPHEVLTSTDGNVAYVSNPQMNAGGHEINVINLKKLKADSSIDTQPFLIPHGMVFRDGRLWYTAQGSKCVVQYNTIDSRVDSVFGTGQDFTHLLWLAADGKKFCTTNVESGTLSIFERKEIPPYMPPTGVLPPDAKPRTEWRQTLINVGFGCEGFDVNNYEDELWTAKPDGEIVVIDLREKKIKTRIKTGVQGLHRLKFSTDGRYVYVVSVKTGELLIYDGWTKRFESKMQIGHGAGIYMDPNGERMFISCTPDNYISVIDLKSKKEVRRIEIGRPDGVTTVNVAP